MSRSFIFGFGGASPQLNSRRLDVFNIDGPAVSVHGKTYGATLEFSDEISIGTGRHKAVLVDTADQGVSLHQSLVFDGLCEWPSHIAVESKLRVVSIEEMSSSSSSLSSSSSTSSSLSSSSSSLSSSSTSSLSSSSSISSSSSTSSSLSSSSST